MFRVIAIFVSRGKGEPMESVTTVQVIEGQGLESDRYATRTGSYSKTKLGKRDVTLFSQEALDRANGHPAIVTPFLPDETRRNILVGGGPENLCEIAHRRIIIGGAEMMFTEECDPCLRPSKLSGKPGFQEAFKENGRGGIRVSVVKSGNITVGDVVRLLD